VIGIGSNIDNTGVGVAYGTARVRFPHWVNGIVNLIGFVFAVAGAWAGSALTRILTPATAQIVACGILSGLGWYMLLMHARQHSQYTSTMRAVPPPGWREGVVLGVALSATNVASSVGAALTTPLTCIGHLAQHRGLGLSELMAG
jgi:putative Mn2+ efflux pump MntP